MCPHDLTWLDFYLQRSDLDTFGTGTGTGTCTERLQLVALWVFDDDLCCCWTPLIATRRYCCCRCTVTFAIVVVVVVVAITRSSSRYCCCRRSCCCWGCVTLRKSVNGNGLVSRCNCREGDNKSASGRERGEEAQHVAKGEFDPIENVNPA